MKIKLIKVLNLEHPNPDQRAQYLASKYQLQGEWEVTPTEHQKLVKKVGEINSLIPKEKIAYSLEKPHQYVLIEHLSDTNELFKASQNFVNAVAKVKESYERKRKQEAAARKRKAQERKLAKLKTTKKGVKQIMKVKILNSQTILF